MIQLVLEKLPEAERGEQHRREHHHEQHRPGQQQAEERQGPPQGEQSPAEPRPKPRPTRLADGRGRLAVNHSSSVPPGRPRPQCRQPPEGVVYLGPLPDAAQPYVAAISRFLR